MYIRKTVALFITFMLVAICFTLPLHGQWIRGGITIGTNLSQVDGDEVYGFKKFGFHGGAVGIIPLKNNFLFSLETIYSQKGAYQNDRSYYYDAYHLKLDYVEIPVMLQYNDRDIFTAGLGLSYARLVDIREWEHGERTNVTLRGDSAAYNRSDYTIFADLRFRLYRHLSFNVRYQYSIAPIRTRTFNPDVYRSWTRKQFNNLLSFRLIYVFNEPVPEKKRKKEED
jgi:hypothetical protein